MDFAERSVTSGIANDQDRTDADGLPTLKGIRDAHGLLPDGVRNTPLTRSQKLSGLFKADVWIKNETVSPIACFKVRGALTDLVRHSRQRSIRGAVTSSTGNHGQGVAYAARMLGFPAHIFLPQDPNVVKRRALETLGAAIYEWGEDLDAAKEEARRFANRHAYNFVDDGESLNVMEGAGTVGLEIAASLKDIDTVFIPMGSGTLAAGSAAAIKALQPRARVIAVQSDGSPAMARSFKASAAVTHTIDTIADGLVCRVPAELALRGLLAFVDDTELVTDRQLVDGVLAVLKLKDLLIEPSAAAAYAGALKRRSGIVGKRIVLVLTGANTTMNALRETIDLHFKPGLEEPHEQ